MALDKSDKLEDVNTGIDESLTPYFTDVFSPGETKQQLEIGKEVKTPINLGVSKKFIGIYGRNTSPGNFVLTGVGFKPTSLKINAQMDVYNNTASIRSFGYAFNGGSGNINYGSGAPNTTNIIHLVNGINVSLATFTSFDDDGFTMNFSQIDFNTIFLIELEG